MNTCSDCCLVTVHTWKKRNSISKMMNWDLDRESTYLETSIENKIQAVEVKHPRYPSFLRKKTIFKMGLDLKTPRVTLGVFVVLCVYLLVISGVVAVWWQHSVEQPNFVLQNTTLYHRNSNMTFNTTILPTTLLKTTKVAIGLAITSKGLADRIKAESVANLQVFQTLLPSFCKTATLDGKYQYGFYIAYDKPDIMFVKQENRALFRGIFNILAKTICGQDAHIKLTFVECDYTAKPAWSQNDVMMKAFQDKNDYYYRINDDTDMQSRNWTEQMIAQLNKYKPPNLGVVGPTHTGGNTKILTYDFVHRTHLEVFGFYYPRVFKDLYGDGWMSEVYGPSRTLKMPQIKLKHTQAVGKRYDERAKGGGAPALKYLKPEIQKGREILRRYVKRISSVVKT